MSERLRALAKQTAAARRLWPDGHLLTASPPLRRSATSATSTPSTRATSATAAAGGGDDARPPPRFVLLTPTEVKERPPPASLVGDVLWRNSLAEVYGPTGSFKTFWALGVALDLAVGGAWVVYVSAEGSAGLGNRIRAWEIDRGRAAPASCLFLLDQPQLLDGQQVEALLAAIAALPAPPALIVIDTLARVTVGAEENSTKDMGLAVAAMDRLRRDTGACVAVVHHPNRAGTNPRGAGCIDGAMDTMIEVKREGDSVGVLCAKQKDAPEFAPIFLERRVVELGGGVTSIVLVPSRGGIAALTLPAQQIARVLWETFGEDGATATLWQRVCAGVSERTFYHARRELLDGGYVANTNPGVRGSPYRATVKYLEASGEYKEAG